MSLDWLVFCDCDYILSALLWRRRTGLWKFPDGGDCLRGKLGLVLLGWAVLFNPIFCWWAGIMMTSFKRSHACTAALSAPNPAAGHHWPLPLQRCLDTHGQVWVSVFWGHCSFLLGPGAHKVLFVPTKSLFPQSCVSSGGSMVGLMQEQTNILFVK